MWQAVVVWTSWCSTQRTVCPGGTHRPIGSNHTSSPRALARIWISTAPAARTTLGAVRPASASPPAIRKVLRVYTGLLQRRRLLRRDVPDDDVVVGLGHAGVPGVVVHINVVDLLLR